MRVASTETIEVEDAGQVDVELKEAAERSLDKESDEQYQMT